jgi:hypothetical protein
MLDCIEQLSVSRIFIWAVCVIAKVSKLVLNLFKWRKSLFNLQLLLYSLPSPSQSRSHTKMNFINDPIDSVVNESDDEEDKERDT